jgi:hypothetical protein
MNASVSSKYGSAGSVADGLQATGLVKSPRTPWLTQMGKASDS